MVPLKPPIGAPSAGEIDHLIDGMPQWYPAGQPTHDDWQIPIIPAPALDTLPTTSRAYDKRQQASIPAETLLHGFIADKKLRTHLRDPRPWVTRFDPFWGVIAPDCSIWLDEPKDRKVFSVRMSRAVGVFHASRGIRVVPSLRWGDHRDFAFAFLGVEFGSAVAISNHGIWRDPVLRQGFVSGLPELVEQITPEVVFLHGTLDHPAITELGRRTHLVHLVPDRTRVRKGLV